MKGDGFLKHMVRYIAGTLFEAGRGNISLSDIDEALKNRQEHKPCPKTKAKGLHLIEISY
jgi:tRNA pseudouridine38-40 synthase